MAKRTPRHQEVWQAPWSLWLKGEKITTKLGATIYSLVHNAESASYWTNKSGVTTTTFNLVNWQAVGKAMLESKRSRRVFIAKHCSGMCGVGKFMYHWKEWDHDLCPRCGISEDSAHMWVCSGFDVVWETALQNLVTWMHLVDTHPDIIVALTQQLNSWKHDRQDSQVPPENIHQAWSDQQSIGSRRLFEGWLAQEWSSVQQRYYDLIHSRRSGQWWTIELIKRLWNIT